jgi:hypothetical protein
MQVPIQFDRVTIRSDLSNLSIHALRDTRASGSTLYAKWSPTSALWENKYLGISSLTSIENGLRDHFDLGAEVVEKIYPKYPLGFTT